LKSEPKFELFQRSFLSI